VANTLSPEQMLTRRRILLAGAVIATAGVLWSWATRDTRTETAAKRRTRRPVARLPAEEVLKPGALPDLAIGQADAPVTIVEYADLSCPACAHFHSKVLPALKEKYIDTGKVRLVFREFPTNTHSILATMTMRCVEPNKAPPLISAMFSRQEDWRGAKSMDELRGKLFSLAQQVGLTRTAFNDCVPANDKLTNQQQKLLADISRERERANTGFGVNQTPTFFVNTTKLAGASIEDFDKALEPLLTR
jgi:protein-disulfide isomerase